MEDYSSVSNTSYKTKNGSSNSWIKPSDKMIMSFLTAQDKFNFSVINLYSGKLFVSFKNMVLKI